MAVIGTGGTIACYVDYRTGAVHPALSAEDLVATVPEMADICDVRAEVLFSIFSENMNVKNWQELAEAVADQLNAGGRGLHHPPRHGHHGLHLGGALLHARRPDRARWSWSERSAPPTVRPRTPTPTCSRRPGSAWRRDAAEVFVLMHETSSDTMAAVHRGTKVRKMHTSRRDAFQSVNDAPGGVGGLRGGHQVPWRSPHGESAGKVTARTAMEKNVALLHFYPGMAPDPSRSSWSSRGVVIAGTGLGHVSADMVKVLKRPVERRHPGGHDLAVPVRQVNLNVYDTGRDLLTAGVISGGDMLPETALVKLMWALAQRPTRRGAGADDHEPPGRAVAKEGDRWLSEMTCGLEIHQQLDTKKLFCSCQTRLVEEEGATLHRRLRPTQSEMGEIDRAALVQAERRMRFRYQAPGRVCCLVDADEEPPHDADEDAMDITLTLGHADHAQVVDEVHFMRKIVIDGSNTTGFQRTALVAVDGFIWR